MRAVVHEQEARLPAGVRTSVGWTAVKVFWTVMSMNYACLSFHVRSRSSLQPASVALRAFAACARAPLPCAGRCAVLYWCVA